MEARLKFNLPEDQDEFTLATKGGDYWNCLWDLNAWLREGCKYHCDVWAKKDGCTVLEEVRDKFFKIMNDRNCSLDDVS